MLRLAVALGLVFSLLIAIVGLGTIQHTSATQALGDYWRVPWKANIPYNVSGNGYGEETHSGVFPYAVEDRWAL